MLAPAAAPGHNTVDSTRGSNFLPFVSSTCPKFMSGLWMDSGAFVANFWNSHLPNQMEP